VQELDTLPLRTSVSLLRTFARFFSLRKDKSGSRPAAGGNKGSAAERIRERRGETASETGKGAGRRPADPPPSEEGAFGRFIKDGFSGREGKSEQGRVGGTPGSARPGGSVVRGGGGGGLTETEVISTLNPEP
jgi:hypothetical protein